MKKFKDRCLTCRHWQGDREREWQKIEAHGDIVMDFVNGWCLSGACGEQSKWAEIEVRGDATCALEVQANFGCVLHSPLEAKP